MKHNKYLIISVTSIIMIVALGVSFAYFAPAIEGIGSNMSITVGKLELDVSDSNVIVNPQTPLKPIYASQVDTSSDAYRNTFTVANSSDSATEVCYSISLAVDSIGANIANKWFKYKLTDGTNTVTGTFQNATAGATKELLTGYYKGKGDTSSNSYTLTLWLEYDEIEDQSFILKGDDTSRTFSGHLLANGESKTCTNSPTYLKDVILADNWAEKESAVSERTNFNTVYPATSSDTRTFFKTNNAELGETVFYYAGDARNNWVIFGKCPETGGKNCTPGNDLYWRIIRTNEESTGGGIRLLYSGSGLQVDENDVHQIKAVQNGYIGTSNWYADNKTPYNVGYTKADGTYTSGTTTTDDIRGTTKDEQINSNIKGVVDEWYSVTFIDSKYTSLIDEETIYCNDRSTTTDKSTGLTANTNFGSYGRVIVSKPSYACGVNTNGFGKNYFGGNDKADRYSKEPTSLGNGWLEYPVGLMTADEVAFAGGVYGKNSLNIWYYLNSNIDGPVEEKPTTGPMSWWTMSPSLFSNDGHASMWGIYGSNYQGQSFNGLGGMVSFSHAVRPVLSLKSDTQWLQGDGTASNPYQIKLD